MRNRRGISSTISGGKWSTTVGSWNCLATVVSKYDDMTSDELWKIIDSYNTWGVISRLELLLPGDIVITDGGKEISSGGVFVL